MDYKMKGSSFYGKNCKCNSDKNSPMKMKTGYPHTGQVGDADYEEMQDNLGMGKGPRKLKGVTTAGKKPLKPGPHPDSDQHIGAVPTFSDFIKDRMNNKKNK